MTKKTLSGWLTVGVLLGGLCLPVFAQGGPGQSRNGFGYGGPPKSEEERALRQAACLDRNNGVCPNGGPGTNCLGRGMGPGNGAGKGWRHGQRDGTGPRSQRGACPWNPTAPAQK